MVTLDPSLPPGKPLEAAKQTRAASANYIEFDECGTTGRWLPALLDLYIHAHAAVLVTYGGDGHSRRYLMFQLDGGALGAGHVGGKRKHVFAGDVLLYADARARVLAVA